MAQSKFIQSVVKAAQGRPRSTDWYREKIKEFGKPGAMDLIRDGKRDNQPFYGRLNMFFYDPKYKKTLPYYDTFPLVLPLEKYPDESTRLAVDYSKLKNISLIKPTLKRYLAGRVKTQFRRIDADEFTVAALLPVARFKKASASEVYKDSRAMI